MTALHLKIIAILTMAVDHAGIFFFPDMEIFRIIGRLSFPLFAFLIANGAYHTKSMKSYLLRLFVFTLISQIPFILAFGTGLNIFFTLFLGLLAIYGFQNTQIKLYRSILLATVAMAALLFDADYGAAGVFSIVGFYVYFNNIKKLILFQVVIFAMFFTFPAIVEYQDTARLNMIALLQPIAAFSLFFIAQYNNREGMKAKYLFYIFYPLHLLIFYYVSQILQLP